MLKTPLTDSFDGFSGKKGSLFHLGKFVSISQYLAESQSRK